VSFWGLLQPLADGLKLLAKQTLSPNYKQVSLYRVSPPLLLFVFFFLWVLILPWEGVSPRVKYNSLAIFARLGLGAYAVILAGWRASSVFSKLGSLRGILQTLSYEVALILVFVLLMFFLKSLHFYRTVCLNAEVCITWITLWLILVLIESNRAPFDLLEGERELISGFNLEMGRLLFVYLFLSEYGILVFFRILARMLLAKKALIMAGALSVFMLLIRSCFPRLRYDSLMSFIWQSLLPLRAVRAVVLLWA